jgi:hypothetical protein
MAIRTWILVFACVTLLASNGCCWHPWGWGHCCRYYEPPGPRVIAEPVPQCAAPPVRQGP